MTEFEKVMDAFVAKGVTPLSVAGAEYGANHLWYQLALTKADRSWIDDFQLFAGDAEVRGGAGTHAAETRVDGRDKGYFTPGSTGWKANDMLTNFTTGVNPMMVPAG